MVAAATMCDVMCGVLNRSVLLSGVPCAPFYRLRESRGYRWEKEEKPEAKEVLQRCRVFLFLYAGPADMAGAARDSSMLGICPLILIGPCWASVR